MFLWQQMALANPRSCCMLSPGHLCLVRLSPSIIPEACPHTAIRWVGPEGLLCAWQCPRGLGGSQVGSPSSTLCRHSLPILFIHVFKDFSESDRLNCLYQWEFTNDLFKKLDIGWVTAAQWQYCGVHRPGGAPHQGAVLTGVHVPHHLRFYFHSDSF